MKLLPVIMAFFVISLNVFADEAAVPMFAVDPTEARLTLLESFPPWRNAYLQAGVAYRSPREQGFDRTKSHCQMSASDSQDIYPGRRMRVRNINGIEQLIENGHAVAGWKTKIETGVSPNLEWTINCVTAQNQADELTIAQFDEIIRGLLDFSGYKTVEFNLSTERTFNSWGPGTSLRFNETMDSAMTDASGRHILFQDGHVARPWESGPYCHTSGRVGHQLAKGATFLIEELAFKYSHTAGLRVNTYTFYDLNFKRPAVLEPWGFSCTPAASEALNNAFRRPTLQEFETAVGSLVTAELPR